MRKISVSFQVTITDVEPTEVAGLLEQMAAIAARSGGAVSVPPTIAAILPEAVRQPLIRQSRLGGQAGVGTRRLHYATVVAQTVRWRSLMSVLGTRRPPPSGSAWTETRSTIG